jgi:hypothetical protein
VLVVWAFAAWTVFVWGTRIRNILADDGGVPTLLAAVALTVLGLLVALGAATRSRWLARVVPIAAVATFVTWAVRVPQILLHDHEVGFVVVHVVLAAVSVALAAGAWRRSAQAAVEPALVADLPGRREARP